MKLEEFNYTPKDADDAWHVLFDHYDSRYPDAAYNMLSKEQLIELCKFLQEIACEYKELWMEKDEIDPWVKQLKMREEKE